MVGQIAKLFIRGKIANRTARDLHPEELEEVGRVCQMVFNDHRLARAKTEFCAALGRTIRAEYKDQEFAQQEAWISFWLAAVDVLHHRPKKNLKRLLEATCSTCKTIVYNKMNEPEANQTCKCGCKTKMQDAFYSDDEVLSLVDFKTDEAEKMYAKRTGHPIPKRDRSIIENPLQRKKFFQTCLFNYLRQILRENARATAKQNVTVRGPADEVAIKAAKAIIKNSEQTIEYKTYSLGGGYKFIFDTYLMTLADVDQLFDLKKLMSMYNIEIKSDEESISIRPVGTTPIVTLSVFEDAYIHNISLDSFKENDDQESFRDHIEAQSDDIRGSEAITYQDLDLSDSAKVVRERLCDTGQRIFDLILNTPDGYVRRFGSSNVRKAHVAKFLNLSPKEVNRQWKIIELQMLAVDLRP